MKISAFLKLAALGSTLIAANAQAALETWQFTGTVYEQNTGFTPPSFAAIGKTITVDYLFDTTASIQNSVKSITFDGEASNVASSNLTLGFLDAINVSPILSRTDSVNFLSFNYFSPPPATSVQQFLNNYSVAAASAGPADSFLNLRLDFGPTKSVWASPTSFVMISSVPEPESYAMLLAGLSLIGFVTRRKAP